MSIFTIVAKKLADGKEVRQFIKENIDERFFKPRGGSEPRKSEEVLSTEVTDLGTQDAPRIALQDLEGRPFVTTMSDRTDAGRVLESVGGKPLSQPIRLTGGQGYMLENADELWASAKSVTPKMVEAGKQARKDAGGVDPVMMNWRMSPSGGDFAHMTGQTMLAYNSANMTKKVKKQLDKDIKELIPDWVGVDDPRSLEQFGQQADKTRKALMDLMDKRYRDKGGLSLPQARLAVADPKQLNAPDLGFQNVGVMDVNRGVISEGGNATYPSAIAGEGLGRLDTDATVIDMLPKLMDGRDTVHQARRALEMKPYTGVITEGMLRRLEDSGKKINSLAPVAATTAFAGSMLAPEQAEAGFFSQAVKAAQALQRKSGNVQSFWNDLTGKGQVKPDELNAMGFKEHFGNRNDISKEEVQQFINDNQISIDEVRLGKPLKDRYVVEPDPEGGYNIYDSTDESREVLDYYGREETAKYAASNMNRYENVDTSKYGRYTLDGGESGDDYRELLMRLSIDPKTKQEIKALQEEALEVNAKQKPLYDELQALLKKETDNNGNFANPDAEKRVLEIESERDRISTKEAQLYSQIHEKMNASGYEGSHFDEEDILTHLRMKDRFDVDGNKTLLLEEVQSDWHQSGKEFGYKNDARRQEIADSLEAIDKRQGEIQEKFNSHFGFAGEPVPLSNEEIDVLRFEDKDLEAKRYELQNEDFALSEAVPNAPFKGDDKSSWYNLAMKRALMEAAEGDYDKLAFTTGVQQADRYNLRNFVSSVKYQEDIVDGRPVNVLTAYDRDGHRVFGKGIKDPQTELPSIIGKEAAEKLLNADPYTPPQETRKIRQLRGQDLELGGEGMKQFYDRTLPNTLNKLVKQDGVKVGQTTLSKGDVSNIGLNEAEQREMIRLESRTDLSDAEGDRLDYLNNIQEIEELVGYKSQGELNADDQERLDYLLKRVEKQGDTVHSIDITPEMRERVKKGLPLFSTAVAVPTVGALFSPEGQAATVSDMAQQYGQLDQRKQQAEANRMALIKAESDRRRNMTRRQRRDNPPSEALRSHTMNQALKTPLAVGLGAIRGSAESLDFIKPENIAAHFLGLPQLTSNYADFVSPLTDIQVLEDKEADERAKFFGGFFGL